MYANALGGAFVYDDAASITGNPDIRTLAPPWSSSASSPLAGRPVVGITFALNYAAGGLDPRGYLAVNILVHVACALALSGIVRRTLAGDALGARFGGVSAPLAGAAALLWMVHPIQTECVDYVTQRTESMMALFYLLALYAAIRARGASAGLWGVASVAACGLGMACKESMVTAPVMIALYDWAYRAGPWRRLARRRLPLYAGLAATWVILAALMATGPRADTVGFGHGVSAWQWALNQCAAITGYLRLVAWPSPLVIDYGVPVPMTLAEAAPHAAVVGLLAAAAAVTLVRRPAAGYPAAWFFAVLAPTSSVVPIANEVAAERRVYLALAGPVVLLVVGAWAILEARAGRRAAARLGAAAVAIVAVALAAGTVVRNAEYRAPVTVWRTAAEGRPGNDRARTNLGIALAAAGRLDEAIAEHRIAAILNPESALARFNLGLTLASAGRFDEALPDLRAAASLEPDQPGPHYNLALALAATGDDLGAGRHFAEAVRLRPGDADAQWGLGKALAKLGEPRAALGHLQRADALRPGRPAILREVAWILATSPDDDLRDGAAALAAAEAAATRAPGDPRTLDALAAACAESGDFERAVAVARHAQQRAAAAGLADLALAIGARAERYAEDEPWRSPAGNLP